MLPLVSLPSEAFHIITLDESPTNETQLAERTMPLRILCLHGFRTNHRVMQDQTRDLRALLGQDAEFVYLNGPMEAEGDSDSTIERVYAEHKPFCEWWRQRTPGGSGIKDAAEAAKAIQLSETGEEQHSATEYIGLEQSIAHVDELIRNQGPFDILLGFSQGSVMITLLTMWYLKQQKPRPWKLNLLFNGYRAYGTNAQYLFVGSDGNKMKVPAPSVHVLGQKDPLCTEGERLSTMYTPKSNLVLHHDGTHRFPTRKRNPEVYMAILRAIEQHCSFKAQAFVGARL